MSFLFFREELDFAYQIYGTTDEAEEAIGYQALSVLAQQQQDYVLVCKEKADESVNCDDFEEWYQLQIFHFFP